MPYITDARGAVNIHSDITSRSDQRFASMQPHSDAQRLVVYPRMGYEGALCFCRRLDCIQSTRKGDKECIALCVYFLPIPFLDCRAQDLMMFCQHFCILISQFIEEIRGPFYVCKKKSNRA